MKLELSATPLAGVSTVRSLVHSDERGEFFRAFCDEELGPSMLGKKIRQVNVSRTSRQGAVRGLHYQLPPAAECKLVRCLSGRVWDVVVDLRRDSPTFLQWHAQELSADNHLMLIIPEGCAHGFQVLESESALLYLHTSEYRPEYERGLHVNDPTLGITWPLLVQDLSERDRTLGFVSPDFTGVCL